MDKTSELALQSKNNPYVRNSFIHENREFILQFSSFVCKRQLDWTNDDELSVAIIAFNEAIDSYNISLGKDFINYAKIVIKNRLIDYFRKESKHRYVPIDVDVDEEVYR
ncbi:MAG TPA: RNA polymerase sigma-I factor, partial [Thermoanaerobacterales bacterium]|nr:RNA polymerase sigma-I factor [Thermoanaerobacterales bacterium]